MRPLILTAALAFSGLAMAQDSDTANDSSFLFPPTWFTFASPFVEQSNVQAPQPARSSSRPKTEGSMIGYIEDAIIGTQIRIRMEAGFDAQFPDRAEFFYAKCGCYQGLAPGNPASDQQTPGLGPGIVNSLNFQQLYVQAEYALRKRLSFFVEVPFRWIQPTSVVPNTGGGPNEQGLSDITAGVKAALIASDSRYVTFQLKSYLPTGNATDGLGTNHFSVEPSLLYYQKLSDRTAIESEAGIWVPISGSEGVPSASNPNPQGFAGNVFFYGVGPSYQVYRGQRVRFTPVIELVGWTVLGGFETDYATNPTTLGVSASGTNIVNLKIGARTDVGGGNSFYLGYGRALTSAVWYSDLVRFEYRHTF